MTKFLDWILMTDDSVLAYSDLNALRRRRNIAAGVLLTSIIAFLSAAFATATSTTNVMVIVLIGGLYSVFIFSFDRSVVTAETKAAVLLRLPIAIMLGLTVSIPMEMALFSGRLDIEITKSHNNHNSEILEDKALVFSDYQQSHEKIYGEYAKDFDELKSSKIEFTDRFNHHNKMMAAESGGIPLTGTTGKEGKGQFFMFHKSEAASAENSLVTIENELKEIAKLRDQKIGNLENLKRQKLAILPVPVPRDNGFLSQYEALESLKASSPSVFVISWGLRVIIILMELLPMILTLIVPKSEYEMLLAARWNFNKNRIKALANSEIAKIEKNPGKTAMEMDEFCSFLMK